MREGTLEEEIKIDDKVAEIRKFFELRMFVLNDFESESLKGIEKIAAERKCDVIRIKGCGEMENYFYKATKIGLYKSLEEDLVLESLPKNKRRGIKKATGFFDFQVTEDRSNKDFMEWFEIYKSRMGGKERGVQILNDGWFENKKVVLAYLKRGDEVAGGHIIFMKKESGEIIPSLAFNASKIEFFKQGINDFVLWRILNWLKEEGFREVKFGTDTNFYGFHLSPGLFNFKASWGFYPKINNEMECLKILNFEKFGDIIFFVTGKENLEGNLLVRENTKCEGNKFFAKNINMINLYEFNKGIRLLQKISSG